MRKTKHRRQPDFHRSRGEHGREELRGYGQQSQRGSPRVVYPFGGRAVGQSRAFGRQFADPLSAYFGVRPDFADTARGRRREAAFGERLGAIEGGDSPLAQFIRQAGSFLPTMFGQAQGAGERIASQAPAAFDALRAQVRSALGQVGGLQQAGAGQVQAAQQMLGEAQSPIASQALYQDALRQALQGAQAGAAGRGLLDAGAAQAGEETMARDLASQFAARRFQEQQGALGGVQQALGAQAGLLPLGAQLAGMEQQGLQQLIPQLAAAYQLPAEAIQQAFSQFAAFQNPLMALMQLTAPQVAQATRGGGFNVI